MGVVIVVVLAVLVAVVLAMLLCLAVIASIVVLIVRALTGWSRRAPRAPRRRAWRPSPPYPLIPSQVRLEPVPVQRRLPADAREQAERIRRKADGLLGQRDGFAPGSRELFHVQRTATDYLPRTLRAYLDLPPGQDDVPVTADGRTALQVLRGQLDLLESRLDEIARDHYRRNLDRLFANGRFLEERFGATSSELDLPVS